MRKSALALLLVLAATPALAQTRPTVPPAPLAVPALPESQSSMLIGNMTVQEAAALGAGLVVGAFAGSSLIGGSFGVVVGGVAGALVGDWWYVNYADEDDH